MSPFRLLVQPPPPPTRLTPSLFRLHSSRPSLAPLHRTFHTLPPGGIPSSKRRPIKSYSSPNAPKPSPPPLKHATKPKPEHELPKSDPSDDLIISKYFSDMPPADQEIIKKTIYDMATLLIRNDIIRPSRARAMAQEYVVLTSGRGDLDAAQKSGVWWGPCVVVEQLDGSLLGCLGTKSLAEAAKRYPGGMVHRRMRHWILLPDFDVENAPKPTIKSYEERGVPEIIRELDKLQMTRDLLNRTNGELTVYGAEMAVEECFDLIEGKKSLDEAEKKGVWWGPAIFIEGRHENDPVAGLILHGYDANSLHEQMGKLLRDSLGPGQRIWVVPFPMKWWQKLLFSVVSGFLVARSLRNFKVKEVTWQREKGGNVDR